MIYYFSEINYRGNHAGTKARNDAETILEGAGYKPVNRKRLVLKTLAGEERIVSNIKNRLDFIPYYMDLFRMSGQTIIIQYPMLSFDIAGDYIARLAKRNKIIFLVHDIQSMRRQDEAGTRKEIELLNLSNGVILHNRYMQSKLRRLGLSVPNVYLLDCFDYLYTGSFTGTKSFHNTVAFAGNLEKSEFLGKMFVQNPDIQFYLYGNGEANLNPETKNVFYKGSFAPDELPGVIEGSFGLVWDGESTDGCSGKFGEYTRINNPHKMSLYIAAGMPVIVWEEAAIAEFVLRNKLGLVVRGVDHLKDILQSVDEKKYMALQENVRRIRDKVIAGQFLRSVLQEIEK